jgi:hypothetical protein
MLLDHFAASQSLPNIAIRYGRLEPQPAAGAALARPDRAGGPERVHADLGELGATATAVLLACVRADGAAAATGAPQLWCKVSVEHPGGDKDKVVLMPRPWAACRTAHAGASPYGHELTLARMFTS